MAPHIFDTAEEAHLRISHLNGNLPEMVSPVQGLYL